MSISNDKYNNYSYDLMQYQKKETYIQYITLHLNENY